MKRVLLFGIAAVSALALNCPAASADSQTFNPGLVHANASMPVNHPTDYSTSWRGMGNFNPGLGFRQQAVLCHVQSVFGTNTSGTMTPGMGAPRPIEVVYVARLGSTCGMAPFYGYGFMSPISP
ncbi:MAG TPA: hypothetical protein VFO29_04085 [Candidatus Rubrimentiphilum sp.]|nr:hypothetical protein [Candidatus Rubrimentiphilum sp.]